jgi:hypothetical protein
MKTASCLNAVNDNNCDIFYRFLGLNWWKLKTTDSTVYLCEV